MNRKSHIIRSRIIIALAIVVIVVAVLFSSLRVAILYIADFTDDIEQLINRQSGLVVEIGRIDTDIRWLTPRLKLLDVSLHEIKGHPPILQWQEIDLSLDWLSSIEHLRPTLGEVTLVGAELVVELDQQGQLIVQGIPLAKKSGESAAMNAGRALPAVLQDFLESTSLHVQQSRILWRDAHRNRPNITLENVNLSVINKGSRHQLAIHMELPKTYGETLQLIIDVDGPLYKPQLWQGRIFMDMKKIQLLPWFKHYLDQLAFTGEGQFDARIWLDWDNSEFRQLDVELDGHELAFRFPQRDIRNWKMQHVSGRLQWLDTDHGWQLEGRNFVVARDNQDWRSPTAFSVQMDDNQKTLQLRSDFLRLDSLAYLTELMNTLDSDNQLDWGRIIEAHQPRGDLYRLYWHLPIEQPLHSQLMFEFQDLGFSSDRYPSVTGLDGYLNYQDQNAQLKLNSSDTVMDFNGLFRNTIDLDRLEGDIQLIRNAEAWHIRSDYLQAQSAYLDTSSRIHITIPDGKPVFADLVTQFSNGDVSGKSLYLPTAIMGKKTVDWLDRSLVKGKVTRGGFLLYGALTDYPYLKNQGVFEVLFDVEDVVLDYMPGWPALSNMNSTVRFHKQSMNILADARVYGAQLTDARIDIENLRRAHLSLDTQINSPLADILKFIDNSPLVKTVGPYITSMEAQGPAEFDLNLQIPLKVDKPVTLNSVLKFQGNRILLPGEGYQFKNARGELRITEKSVQSDRLRANLDGYPFDASIATMSSDDGKFTRVIAEGRLPATSLLAPVPILKPYIKGISDWQAQIFIPYKNEKAKLEMFIKSNLSGISTDLPMPLKKNPDQKAPFNMRLSLLSNDELELDLDFENHYSWKSRRNNNIWRVHLDSSVFKGKARFNQDFSKDEPMLLDIDLLDLEAYMEQFKQKDQELEVSGLDIAANYLPDIELQARKVIWKNLQVSDASLDTRRTALGMDIEHFELHGPAVSIIGKGSWQSSWLHKHVTQLEMNVSSNDFGRFLSEVNLTQSVKNASGDAKINWQWYAEPYKFDWRILHGQMDLEFEKGRLLDIDPGAGRVLGLLNFETLLSLDFGNQVSEGFAFDSIEGSFTFANGNAYTTNFDIAAKVADINVEGRIGLSTEDYDQVVTVIPGVGSTLTVLGAVAGGATLAATVMFVQKILGINRMVGYKYSISGSWQDPKVKLLSAPEETEN